MLSHWKANIQVKPDPQGSHPLVVETRSSGLAASPDWIWKSHRQALSSPLPHGDAWGEPQAQHDWTALNNQSDPEGCWYAARSSTYASVVRAMPVCRVTSVSTERPPCPERDHSWLRTIRKSRVRKSVSLRFRESGDRYVVGNAFSLEVEEDDRCAFLKLWVVGDGKLMVIQKGDYPEAFGISKKNNLHINSKPWSSSF